MSTAILPWLVHFTLTFGAVSLWDGFTLSGSLSAVSGCVVPWEYPLIIATDRDAALPRRRRAAGRVCVGPLLCAALYEVAGKGRVARVDRSLWVQRRTKG